MTSEAGDPGTISFAVPGTTLWRENFNGGRFGHVAGSTTSGAFDPDSDGD